MSICLCITIHERVDGDEHWGYGNDRITGIYTSRIYGQIWDIK